MNEQKQYTLQEKIDYYKNEIVQNTLYQQKCARRLSQLLAMEVKQMQKNMLDEVRARLQEEAG